MKQIKITHWNHTCGEGCCYDDGVQLEVDGVTISNHFDRTYALAENLLLLSAALGVEVEVEEVEDYEN